MLLKRAENDAANDTNSFDKNKSDEVEFYNRLQDNYAKKAEYKVDEASLKAQQYTDDQIKQYKEQQQTKLNELHYDTIIGFTTERTQLELDKAKLEAQKSALEKSLDEYKITAPQSGRIHLANQIINGMVIQAGNSIASITSDTDKLVVETMLSSSERPMVHKGDEVSLAVAGLNQSEYGTVKGKITAIDQDASVDNQKGNIYFKLIVKPDKTYLTDKKGEKVNLALGMVAETRVKYDKITYMKYFLEQIGVKFN